MIVGQRRLSRESVKRGKPSGWAVCRAGRHPDGYGSIEPNNWRWGRWADLEKCVVEKDNPLPVSICCGAGPGMTGDDCGLQRVVTRPAAQPLRMVKCSHASLYLDVVPPRPVLVEQQNGFSVLTLACRGPRRLQLHQRQQTVDLRFIGKKFHEDAPQPQRVITKLFPHPLIAEGGRISFVEDEVDHRENGLKPAAQLVRTRDLECNMCYGESPFSPKDSLAKGLLR